jgi:hypothetical protein
MRKTLLAVLILLTTISNAQSRRRAMLPPEAVRISDDFRNGFLGWEARFATIRR